MAAAAALLAVISLEIDRRVQDDLVSQIGLFWTGGAEGARELLSTVAGSTITVAGVVFSMTLVVLSLASSQFGPRILRHFMADRGTQVVLGTFIATFVFSLLVLRNVRSMDEVRFVPSISVTLAIAFTLASLGVLIFFIHHVATSIQAPQLVARVGQDVLESIDAVFPEHLGHPPPEAVDRPVEDLLPADFDRQSRTLLAERSGYLQSVDEADLIERTVEANLIARVLVRPGHFVVEGQPLAYVWPASRVDDETLGKLANSLTIGRERTPTQDVELLLEQLVQVAVRALSPGVNDPFTAISCIDWLGAALSRAAGRSFPEAARFDHERRLRVVVENPLTFDGLLALGVNQIRQHSAASVAVSIRLLEMLAQVMAQTESPARRRSLLGHSETVYRMARESTTEVTDQSAIEERFVRLGKLVAETRDLGAHPDHASRQGRDENVA
jgi:uncharacterized membrane protein